MLLSRFGYARPDTVEEAIALLAGHDNARVLAGGQSLVNVMKTRMASPDVLVDVNRIAALKGVGAVNGSLELGAMVTYASLADSPDVRSARPIVAEVADRIGDVQVRNRGTLGGNVCFSDPTNHLPPVLVSLGAEMTIVGGSGARVVPADDFFVSVFMTAVQPDELLSAVRVPALRPGVGDAFSAVTTGAEGTSVVAAAATVTVEDGLISACRLALGCVAAVPVRASAVEEALDGQSADRVSIEGAVLGLGETLDPPSDAHASGQFRKHLAEVCATRALRQALDRANGA